MIEVIEGKGVGAGKSYMVLERLMLHWLKGGTACVSDTVEIKWDDCKAYAALVGRVILDDSQLRVITAADTQRLHEVTPAGSGDCPVLIVVDEAQDAFNARDWSDKGKRGFFAWLCQSRHDDNDVIILSQSAANVDKQVRRLCTFIWITRNTEFFPIAGHSMSDWIRWITFGLNHGKYFIRTQLDQDGRTPLQKKWVRGNYKLFGCYESKSMRMKHQRATDEAVARLMLEKVKPPPNARMKYIIPVVVIASLFAVCKLAFGGGKQKAAPAKTSIVAPGAAGAPGEASRMHDGQVIRATLNGSFKGFLQTAEHGVFEVGHDSALGWVEAIDGFRARVRVDSKTAVTVQAFPRGSRPIAAAAAPAR
jgi:hypothetical protein